ncbi:unnamed protein product [Darwinula stevensoni]|uniref:UDP-N-acetylglucosamine 4-epimerase n=1 Tax=Darwinula stevensoni TaxID=69355 RepID=A0A7R8ZXR8_9CRUS|nr:unnamed protein product [Darwinula stevensoni]CAG0879940.1 unnamed protein product [Darwinula stevensoni]
MGGLPDLWYAMCSYHSKPTEEVAKFEHPTIGMEGGSCDQLHILVTGGAGYVGSHTVVDLLEKGHNVVVVDNLCNVHMATDGKKPESLLKAESLTGRSLEFHKLDIVDKEALQAVFSMQKFDCVFHFAALKAVGESCAVPLKYYRNNVGGTANLLEVMQENGVMRIIYSSSCTVYGDPLYLPIDESHPMGKNISSPYGRTKAIVEHMMMDLCHAQKDLGCVFLRYFNPVGAHPSGELGEDPLDTPSNLMPYISQVAIGKRDMFYIFGVRDYVHVMDVARGHTAALKKLMNPDFHGWRAYNLGRGKGYSVIDVVKEFEKASGKNIPFKVIARRPGDLPFVYANPKLAYDELGWKAQSDLDDICRDAWNWQMKYPHGSPWWKRRKDDGVKEEKEKEKEKEGEEEEEGIQQCHICSSNLEKKAHPLQCSSCSNLTCDSCIVWNPGSKLWTCNACLQRKLRKLRRYLCTSGHFGPGTIVEAVHFLSLPAFEIAEEYLPVTQKSCLPVLSCEDPGKNFLSVRIKAARLFSQSFHFATSCLSYPFTRLYDSPFLRILWPSLGLPIRFHQSPRCVKEMGPRKLGVSIDPDSENDSGCPGSVSPAWTEGTGSNSETMRPPVGSPTDLHASNGNESGPRLSLSPGERKVWDGCGIELPEVDPTTAEVREHVETLVETFIGLPLDNASVEKIFDHPSYDAVMDKYCGPLGDALTRLSYALQMAINNEPLGEDETPSTLHATLKKLIEDLKRDVRTLPPIPRRSNDSSAKDSCSFSSQPYEDLLAIAILNKVIQEHVDGREVQTDADGKKSKLKGSKYGDVGIQPDMDELAESHLAVDSDTDSDRARSPLAYVIEEQIEEITTTYETDSEAEEGEDGDKKEGFFNEPYISRSVVTDGADGEKVDGISDLDFICSALNFTKEQPVPFPELGLDLAHGSPKSEDEDLQEGNYKGQLSHVPLESWKENWLFQKRKVSGKRNNPGAWDVDELSDLSEQESYQSVEYSSEEEFEVVPDHEQHILNQSFTREPLRSSSSGPSSTGNDISQKDSEYTEDYDRVQTRTKSWKKSPSPTPEEEENFSYPQTQHPVPKPRSHNVSHDNVCESNVPTYLPPLKRPAPPIDLSFSINPVTLTLHAGKALRLRCSITAAQQPFTVFWYHNGEALVGLDDVYMYQVRNTFHLERYNTMPSHGGIYTCAIHTKTGQRWQDCQVVIRKTNRAHQPPVFVRNLPEEVVYDGRPSLQLQCQVDGYPEPSLCIFQDGTKLERNAVELEPLQYGEWTLTLKSGVADLSGRYEVEAWNSVGRARSSCQVISSSSESLTAKTNPNPSLMPSLWQSQHQEQEKPGRSSRADFEVSQAISSSEEALNQVSLSETSNETRTRDVSDLHLDGPPRPGRPSKEKKPSACPPPDTHSKSEHDSHYPIPGTIAEREHLKWLKAKPLSNNPYSAENIARRMQKMDLRNTTHLEDPAFVKGSFDDVNTTNPYTINCGPKSIDPDQYRRDYYIPGEETRKRRTSYSPPKQQQQFLSLQPQVNQVSARQTEAERPQVTEADNSGIPEEQELHSLPSVRQLASKFLPSTENPQVIIVEKQGESSSEDRAKSFTPSKPQLEIHSLTARSMPAEIREAMKKQRPKERNRNIAVVEEGFRRSASSVPELERNNPSPEHLGIPNVPKRLNGKKCEEEEISGGYTSDESSGSQSHPPTSARRKPKTSSIASRAAYWDQRVSQGLSSDSQLSPRGDIPDFT